MFGFSGLFNVGGSVDVGELRSKAIELERFGCVSSRLKLDRDAVKMEDINSKSGVRTTLEL